MNRSVCRMFFATPTALLGQTIQYWQGSLVGGALFMVALVPLTLMFLEESES